MIGHLRPLSNIARCHNFLCFQQSVSLIDGRINHPALSKLIGLKHIDVIFGMIFDNILE